ncbi:MAG: hypothetical protein KDE45_20060 [Caldilineaceae bacterium]|nr:hypothetical protein [Caldilineaceae bacterium]
MSTTIPTSGQERKRKSGGRRPFYGVPTIQFPIYLPDLGLKEKIEDEALARNVRDRNPERAWTVSRVVVDILLDHFGMPKPNTKEATDGTPTNPQP